jgi:SAM-dependent methyltransferase
VLGAAQMTAPDTTHYEGQDLEALGDLVRYQSWILRWIRPHLRGRVLEVGAGTGAIADHYVDLVGEAVLLEPAANLAVRLRARFGDRAHVSVHEGTLESFQRPDGSLDAVVMVNVLEHIPDDVGALRRLYALLRPGGVLAIMVPAMGAIYGSLDARVGHVRRYERAQLRGVVTEAGFRVETLRWLDAAGVIPWFVVGRVLRQRRFSPGAARLYDRVAVPVSRVLEEWIEPPWGKNLLCIARRDP